MTDRAVISGNYSDLKLVKTRSVCQLVIEIPIERAEEAIRIFGIPVPGEEKPVAIALLNIGEGAKSGIAPSLRDSGDIHGSVSANRQATVGSSPTSPTAKSLRARELYDSGTDAEKAVVRAALLAKDIEFQKWIGVDTEEQAAKKIRETCGVQSRGDIAHYDYALNNFLDIEWQYRHREDGRASA